jgi:hypothetical protein
LTMMMVYRKNSVLENLVLTEMTDEWEVFRAYSIRE